jgi:hypothetical protein
MDDVAEGSDGEGVCILAVTQFIPSEVCVQVLEERRVFE